MDNISRKDLDRMADLLQNHVNTEESIQLAEKLREADVIPKLYVYTYFKRIRQMMDDCKVHLKEFDWDEWNILADQTGALSLYLLKNKREVRVVKSILNAGFEREGQFCDFNDSEYHSTRRHGSCQNEEHENFYCDEKRQEFVEGPNKNLLLIPVYQADEDTYKYTDEPDWWCQRCCDAVDLADMDFVVSCDMDIEEID